MSAAENSRTIKVLLVVSVGGTTINRRDDFTITGDGSELDIASALVQSALAGIDELADASQSANGGDRREAHDLANTEGSPVQRPIGKTGEDGWCVECESRGGLHADFCGSQPDGHRDGDSRGPE